MLFYAIDCVILKAQTLLFSESPSKFFETLKKDSDKTINYLS